MEIIDSFLHRHPLELIEEYSYDYGVHPCDGCQKRLYEAPIYGCITRDCEVDFHIHYTEPIYYGCIDCDFYLHKFCTELPKEVHNFFHPCPLFLKTIDIKIDLPLVFKFRCGACFEDGSGFGYRCDSCKFDMHLKCALKPTRIGGDCEDVIQHFTHWHPLRLVDENRRKDLQVGCGICEKLVCLDSASAAYGCEECKFYVHKSCININIPRQINSHSFHPSCPGPLILRTTKVSYKCAGCDDKHVSGLVYRCTECEFQLDVKCALLPTLEDQSKDIADKLQYVGHKHPLVALRHNNKDDNIIIAGEVDRCQVCGEKCSLELDEDPCFGCERCDLFLHKSCMINIPQQINNHSFHPSCPLILLPPLPSSYRCAGCGDKHVSGLAYSCRKCGFQLDVKCALLPTLDHYKDADDDRIQYVGHKHPLLALRHSHNNYDQCGVCREKCRLESDEDPCFGCERCRFFIHRTCAVEFTAEAEIHHHFHPLHPLTLSPFKNIAKSKIDRCSACLGWIDKSLLIYRCVKCEFNLHVDCAKPKLTATTRELLVKYEGHSHPLIFFDKTVQHTDRCDNCGTPARNCYFRCVACRFNIHLYCHPSAPNTITHNCHLHPLTLAESPFEFESISPQFQEEDSQSDDEFYCDVCEEKRDKKESVYYCKECKFIAETRCVISELLPSLTGSDGHHTREGKVISIDEENSALEAFIAKRTDEIAKLRKMKEPLGGDIRRCKAQLRSLENRHIEITRKLDQFETDIVLWNYQLNHNLEGKKKATETSTSIDVTKVDGK